MFYNRFKRIIYMIILAIFFTPILAHSQDNSQPFSAPKFNNEELTQMLAPIALYPDPLLSQILIAASYPFEVVEADRWLSRNPNLKGDALDNALKEKNWDVSVLSLCHYPKVLTMMSDNLNWTSRLGDAFVNQQQDLMDIVQDLRAKANAQGNLTTTKEQKVIVEDNVISIEPAYANYIYVPVYDPFVIYGPWWYPAYLPFPIFFPGIAVMGPRIVFSPRFFVGFGVIGWCGFNWRARNVVILNIPKTARFNRHVSAYRNAERFEWRPDNERRFVRERRAREIPQYRAPVRPVMPIPAEKRRGGEILPRKSEPVGERKPVIERDKREERERGGDQHYTPREGREDRQEHGMGSERGGGREERR